MLLLLTMLKTKFHASKLSKLCGSSFSPQKRGFSYLAWFSEGEQCLAYDVDHLLVRVEHLTTIIFVIIIINISVIMIIIFIIFTTSTITITNTNTITNTIQNLAPGRVSLCEACEDNFGWK